MTTPPILEKTAEVYNPTAQDRIQRVLYRLDSGEQLIKSRLRINDNFCALGLFLDEYPDGEWVEFRESEGDIYYQFKDNNARYKNRVELSLPAANYYGFRDIMGTFKLSDIDDKVLRDKLDRALPTRLMLQGNTGLGTINDYLIGYSLFHDEVNTLIASLIRSGVLFK